MEDRMWESFTEEQIRTEFNMPFTSPFRSESLSIMAAAMKLLPPAPAKILDCGIGIGWSSAWLSMAGYNVIGIDSSDKIIELARKNITRYGASVDLRVGAFENCILSSPVDAVVFFRSLHHTNSWRQALCVAKDNLRAGGTLILVEPGIMNGKRKLDREFMKQHPTAVELSMPPLKSVPMLKKLGYKRIRVFPNYGFLFKLINKPIPLTFGALAVYLYKWFDGIVAAEKEIEAK
jgi:SAM-dependent methyltransferase